jgi:MFS family permease
VIMPLYFEGALKMSADQSGTALIPVMAGTVIGATISGRMMPHLRRYKIPALVGLAVACASALALAAFAENMALSHLVALLTLFSLGTGAMLPISTVSVQNAVDFRHLGAATATMQFVRQIACALIVAALGALVIGPGEAASPTAFADAAELAARFRLAFIVIAACAALSLVFLVRMEAKPLRATAH